MRYDFADIVRLLCALNVIEPGKAVKRLERATTLYFANGMYEEAEQLRDLAAQLREETARGEEQCTF